MENIDFGKTLFFGVMVGLVLGTLALLVGMWIGNHVTLMVS